MPLDEKRKVFGGGSSRLLCGSVLFEPCLHHTLIFRAHCYIFYVGTPDAMTEPVVAGISEGFHFAF
jgi:hypothetical protein